MPLITWPQRCSHPLCSSQSTDGPATTIHREPTTTPTRGTGHEQFSDDDCQPTFHQRDTHHKQWTLVPSGPNSVPHHRSLTTGDPMPAFHPHEQTRPKTLCSGHGSGHPHQPHHRTGQAPEMLLRKEVIQPHLPVRLPCYDFVPIASPTFDSSLPKGLGHWLRVLPTFVT